jgi:hypothetical protein
MQITKKYDVFVCFVKKSNGNYKNTVKIYWFLFCVTLVVIDSPSKKQPKSLKME